MQDQPPERQTPNPAQPDVPVPPERDLDDTSHSQDTRYVPARPPEPVASPRRQDRPDQRRAGSKPPRPAVGPPPRAPYGRPSAPPVPDYPPPPIAAGQQPYSPPPHSARRARTRAQTPPSESGLYLPWWSLVILVGVVGLAAFGTLYLASTLGQAAAPGNQTPRVQVITAPPTLSQDFTGGAGVASAPQANTSGPGIPQAAAPATVPLPTPVPSQTLPPGEFQIGTRVRVVGVGLNGLNVRSAPGLSGSQRFLAYDDDEFVLIDGPQDADSLEWWRIEDPDDPDRQGWAARNYLEAVDD